MALFERHQAAEERADRRVALVAAAIFEVNRDPKKRSKPFSPDDFIPKAPAKKKKDGDAMIKTIQALHAAIAKKGGDA